MHQSLPREYYEIATVSFEDMMFDRFKIKFCGDCLLSVTDNDKIIILTTIHDTCRINTNIFNNILECCLWCKQTNHSFDDISSELVESFNFPEKIKTCNLE